MTPELSIVKLFLKHTEWNAHKDSLSVKDFPKDIQGLVRTLYAFHSENKERDLSVADLSNLYFATHPPNREFMEGVLQNLDSLEASADTTLALINGIRTNNVMRELSITSYEAAEGRKSLEDVQKLLDQLEATKAEAEQEDEFTFVTTDLEELINGQILKPGLRWRLDTLNKMLGSLRLGDFGFIFARPETGKTTFLASEVTHMASQADRPIIWFANEEQGEKVMLRSIQAYFGINMVELYRRMGDYKKRFQEELGDKFLLYDSASISQRVVERACERYKPSLIVFDQIDKIQSPANDREDLRLGAIYQWARELAKTYAPTIGVSQADGSGEGVKWLTMSNVANAKTAKQAEADWILGIGKTNEPGYETLRFLHASKNKLLGDEDTIPDLRHGRREVLIDIQTARYADIS